MLNISRAGLNDILYDLGSGDGRVPITAVMELNVKRAVGIEVRRDLVGIARDKIRRLGPESRVEVTFYLNHTDNKKLRINWRGGSRTGLESSRMTSRSRVGHSGRRARSETMRSTYTSSLAEGNVVFLFFYFPDHSSVVSENSSEGRIVA